MLRLVYIRESRASLPAAAVWSSRVCRAATMRVSCSGWGAASMPTCSGGIGTGNAWANRWAVTGAG